jgi:hypothetical protein
LHDFYSKNYKNFKVLISVAILVYNSTNTTIDKFSSPIISSMASQTTPQKTMRTICRKNPNKPDSIKLLGFHQTFRRKNQFPQIFHLFCNFPFFIKKTIERKKYFYFPE